jgi:hypothetical protein
MTDKMLSSDKRREGIYVASRVCRAEMWKKYRAQGRAVISTWIDEAGEGETDSFTELWGRLHKEIAACNGLIFYGDVTDAPWKGALVEVGIALGLGKPVAAVILGEVEGRTYRPVGSWLEHPGVRRLRNVSEAFDYLESLPCIPSHVPPSVNGYEVAAKLVRVNANLGDLAHEENTTLAGTVRQMHDAVIEAAEALKALHNSARSKVAESDPHAYAKPNTAGDVSHTDGGAKAQEINDALDVAECCIHDQIKDPNERDHVHTGLRKVRALALAADLARTAMYEQAGEIAELRGRLRNAPDSSTPLSGRHHIKTPVRLEHSNSPLGDTGDHIGHSIIVDRDGNQLLVLDDTEDEQEALLEAIVIALNGTVSASTEHPDTKRLNWLQSQLEYGWGDGFAMQPLDSGAQYVRPWKKELEDKFPPNLKTGTFLWQKDIRTAVDEAIARSESRKA